MVEVVIAAACAIVLGTALASIAHAAVGWSIRAQKSVAAQRALDRAIDRWQAESATAWSVFTPRVDVFGAENSDGHEFDMVTVDSRRRPAFLAFVYDSSRGRLAEYAYGSRGSAPVPTGDASDGVTAFDAHTYPLRSLQAAGSPIYDPLFAGARIADAVVPLQLGNEASGGNRLTRVHIAFGRFDRVVMLAAETAPSAFTIVVTYTPAP